MSTKETRALKRRCERLAEAMGYGGVITVLCGDEWWTSTNFGNLERHSPTELAALRALHRKLDAEAARRIRALQRARGK